MDGRSGSLMSLIFCGKFISFTADTALAGAADIPACSTQKHFMLISQDRFRNTHSKIHLFVLVGVTRRGCFVVHKDNGSKIIIPRPFLVCFVLLFWWVFPSCWFPAPFPPYTAQPECSGPKEVKDGTFVKKNLKMPIYWKTACFLAQNSKIPHLVHVEDEVQFTDIFKALI